MRHLLLVLAAVAAVALTVAGVTITVGAVNGLSEVRVEATRTPVPGERTVDLDQGKYVLFYEVSDEGLGEDESVRVPDLEVRLRDPGGTSPLDLDDYSSEFNVSSGGRKAEAIATVEVPEDGLYALAVSGSASATSPAVVLGKPITRRIVRVVVGIVGAFAGVALLALVGALAIALAVRGPKTAE